MTRRFGAMPRPQEIGDVLLPVSAWEDAQPKLQLFKQFGAKPAIVVSGCPVAACNGTFVARKPYRSW